MIGDNVVLSILEINGDQVRIGVEAPSNITIYREEIFEAIQQQNKEAMEFDEDIQTILRQAASGKNK
ncbi:hypothetical protein J14TS5_51570 [Paenibacillus lautus]|nr:hypothetical protein J14TS5_51570 [Paenibacillus lautus]